MSYFDETLKDWVKTQQAGAYLSSIMTREYTERNKRILGIISRGVTERNIQSILRRIKKLDVATQKKLLTIIEKQLADVANITIRNEIGNIELLGVTPTAKTYSTIGVSKAAMNSPMRGSDRTPTELLKDVFGSGHVAATNIIRRGVTEGITGSQMRKALKDRFNVDNRHLATSTATAMNAIANGARNEFYSKNKDVINKVMWRSTLDSATSPICQSLDGRVWPVDEAHPNPPAHPNCRSFLVPVVEGVSDKHARAMMRPAVVDGEAKRTRAPTYGDWLSKQNKGFQEQVLGKKRTELFRKGELEFNQFFTSDGRQLTLLELEQKT